MLVRECESDALIVLLRIEEVSRERKHGRLLPEVERDVVVAEHLVDLQLLGGRRLLKKKKEVDEARLNLLAGADEDLGQRLRLGVSREALQVALLDPVVGRPKIDVHASQRLLVFGVAGFSERVLRRGKWMQGERAVLPRVVRPGLVLLYDFGIRCN